MLSHSKCSLKMVSESLADTDGGIKTLQNFHSIQKVKNMIFHTAQYHHPMSPILVDPMKFQVMWDCWKIWIDSVVNLREKLHSRITDIADQAWKLYAIIIVTHVSD